MEPKLSYLAGILTGAVVFAQTKLAETSVNQQANRAVAYIRLASETASQATTQTGSPRANSLEQAQRYLARSAAVTRTIPDEPQHLQVLKGELDDMNARVLSGLNLQAQADVAHHDMVRASLSAHAFSAFSAGKTAAAWSFLARPSLAWKKAVLAGSLAALLCSAIEKLQDRGEA